LISIAGGKLTGFRKMAERSVNVVCKQLKLEEGRQFAPCTTASIPLSGGDLNKSPEEYAKDLQEDFKQFFVEDILDLVLKYGSNTVAILALAQTNFNNQLLPAEAEYCLEHEMTASLADFVIRRSGRLYFERPAIAAQRATLDQYFQEQLGYTGQQMANFHEAFEKEYEGVMAFQQ
ncbi:MAG TPA: glycerol-3-phosphate dehydrogenase C-terminal domain-containing protein, partial [Chitinophagales bacterium]|nr:glycerol-3-phosphate dehydrogenase C-terminal domain-containing protein [Chitinophagales bacterium]